LLHLNEILNLKIMMKILQLFALLSFLTILGQQSTNSTVQKFLSEGGIICDYVKYENLPVLEINTWFRYTADGEVLKIQTGLYDTFSAKLDRTYTEQGLLIKEYTPTNHLTQNKRIFRFCYEENS